jgi:hypothetical protein
VSFKVAAIQQYSNKEIKNNFDFYPSKKPLYYYQEPKAISIKLIYLKCYFLRNRMLGCDQARG